VLQTGQYGVGVSLKISLHVAHKGVTNEEVTTES